MPAKEIIPQNPPENQLQNAWKKICEFGVDLATIDVTTTIADVTIDLNGDAAFKPNEMFEQLKGKIREASTLTLVAHTHIDFDLDSVTITKPGAAPEMLEAHNQAVKTAIDARQAVIRLVKECFLK